MAKSLPLNRNRRNCAQAGRIGLQTRRGIKCCFPPHTHTHNLDRALRKKEKGEKSVCVGGITYTVSTAYKIGFCFRSCLPLGNAEKKAMIS